MNKRINVIHFFKTERKMFRLSTCISKRRDYLHFNQLRGQSSLRLEIAFLPPQPSCMQLLPPTGLFQKVGDLPTIDGRRDTKNKRNTEPQQSWSINMISPCTDVSILTSKKSRKNKCIYKIISNTVTNRVPGGNQVSQAAEKK